MIAVALRRLAEVCLPCRADYAGGLHAVRRDFIAGLTVGIVALPLALGFGVSSGMGAAAGLITAVVAAVVAAIFGGSRFQVSGPTGAMTVVLVPIVGQFGVGAVVIVALLAVVLATAIAAVAHLTVATVGALPDSLPMPAFPVLDLFTIRALAGPALAVAMLCAIESLLSARVADRLAGATGARASDPDRELFGQGLATVASGLFGGMPATGAIARTAVNVRAGAQTRVAALVHSDLLLGVVYLAAPLVGRIPWPRWPPC